VGTHALERALVYPPRVLTVARGDESPVNPLRYILVGGPKNDDRNRSAELVRLVTMESEGGISRALQDCYPLPVLRRRVGRSRPPIAVA
jgi:hypothetical protein